MKTISLNKGTIDLPECWSDLTTEQKRYAFTQLMLLYAGEIKPDDFRIRMFIKLTGYRPGRKDILYYCHRLLRLCRISSSAGYKDFTDEEERFAENIQMNILRLADLLDFAFTLDDKKIIPNYFFNDNPFPALSKDAPHFLRNYTVETTITAQQYIDVCELLAEISKDTSDEVKQHLLVKTAEILYKIPYTQAEKLPADILFGISFWFTGIAKFFREHPKYRVLFASRKAADTESDDPLSIGMSETLLYLQKEGYGADVKNMNLIDFFNAQVKALKDSIAHAAASGAKPEEIANRTGIDIATVTRFSK